MFRTDRRDRVLTSIIGGLGRLMSKDYRELFARAIGKAADEIYTERNPPVQIDWSTEEPT